mgnify:CR=1 FL=1
MLLSGKKGLIIGVANKHSIAWAIAQSAAAQGAQLYFNYQNERLKENVEELVATMPGSKAFPCDVGDDAQIETLMQHVGKEAGRLDFLVHSVAFAPREELTGQFVNTTRKGFATALDVSAYSLVAVTKAALPFMTEGGSVVTLTYLGAERVVQNYNVMGVAKAALEALEFARRDVQQLLQFRITDRHALLDQRVENQLPARHRRFIFELFA